MKTWAGFFITLMSFMMTFDGKALAQAVGGGGSGGGGFTRVAARSSGCEEGRRSLFFEAPGSDPDRRVGVYRTCRNGSYYDLSDYIYNPSSKCRKEGAVEIWTELIPNTSEYKSAVKVCRNGKWVDRK